MSSSCDDDMPSTHTAACPIWTTDDQPCDCPARPDIPPATDDGGFADGVARLLAVFERHAPAGGGKQ